jgi:hypothetical protein
LKEDQNMRLYEFTDPTKYFLRDVDAADPLEQGENVWTDDTAHDAARHQTGKLETKQIRPLDRR